MSKKSPELSIEDALIELEAIVSRMESGNHSLEKSLEDFERGIEIVKNCRKLLKDAELKVETLAKGAAAEDSEA